MRLIGDIGGTKVILALADEQGALHAVCRLASADFDRFDDLLAHYLAGQPSLALTGGCLAVAGPVAADGRSAQITNLPWFIDCAALEQRYGFTGLRLINDLAAIAHAIMRESWVPLHTLHPGTPVADGPRLVIGVGTGLGMALSYAGHVLASEGGHVGFSPQNEVELQLWSRLHAEFGRVTAERVISGPGLATLHRVLHGEAVTPETVVTRAARGEVAAVRSVAVFCAALGAFVGDMALATLATGGIYLAGGVAAHLLPWLTASPEFLTALQAKAEHASLVARMPVYLINDPMIGLRGALAACESA